MNKEKNILLNYILYFATFFVICIIGISNVFALEYTDIGYVHDLSGVNGHVTIDVTYETESGAPLTINRNQVVYTQLKVMNVFISNYSFEANRQYQIEMEFPYQQLQFANTYQVFGSNNELCSLNYSNSIFNSQWPRWNFSCLHSTNEIYLKVYNSNNTAITNYGDWSWNYMYIRYTNTSIDSDITDTDSITNNANQNADRIINNQNQNTQDIINNQNELFGSQCDNLFDYNKTPNENNLGNFTYTVKNGVFTFNGTDSNYKYIGYNIELKKGNYYYGGVSNGTGLNGLSTMLIANDTKYVCNNSLCEVYLNSDQTIIFYPFRLGGSSYTANNLIVKPYISQTNQSFCEYGSYSSKLDEQTKTSKGILGKLKDLFDTLFSNDDADISGLDNMVGWLPPGPVDSIINLPLSFFNSLTNTLTGTCRAVSLNIPFVNQTLVLPCFDAYMSKYLTGFNTLWTFVGVTLSVFILYYYLLSLYKWVDDTLTFRENNLPGYYGDNWGGGA